MYKWFLAIRYLHTKLIAFFGVASVMLCVAMVIVVMSVMGGFLDTVRARSKGLNSEIVVDGLTSQGFPFYEEFGGHLKSHLPDVVRLTTPTILTYAVFRVPATTYTREAQVVGIRLDDYVKVTDFAEGLYYNRYYPRTTHLRPQQMPVAGFSENGSLRLPDDLEQASDAWRKAEPDSEAVAAFDRAPFEQSPYPHTIAAVPGDRVYSTTVGEPYYADAPFYGVIVGCDLLNIRKPDGNFERVCARGTPMVLNVLPLTRSGNVTSEPLFPIPVRYADDSRTGIYEIDRLCVYVDFDMLQHRLAMDPQPLASDADPSIAETRPLADNTTDMKWTRARASRLLVGLVPGTDLDTARERISQAWERFRASLDPDLSSVDEQALSFVQVSTWEDLQRPFIAAVEKEKVLVTFLFALISVVAIVLLGCIFYMIVEKKTRDIGILKSLGASAPGVAVLFIAYAAAVGVVGSILGALVGSLFVWNINDIQDLLAAMNPALRVWNPEVYSFDKIPEVVKRADVLWVGSLAIVSAMLGSLIPAIIAGRIWPVRALRYE